MKRADLPFAQSLSRDAGWNQTADDWLRFLNYQPDGCFVAEWHDLPAGTVTTTVYGKRLAWIGMLLVAPEHRGRGIGTALLEHAIRHLRTAGVPCIKLDATPQGQPIYERIGFKVEWSLQRWAARSLEIDWRASSPKTRPVYWVDYHFVKALDLAAYGEERFRMLGMMMGGKERWLVNRSPKEFVTGFGMMRKGANAEYLGPVVAESVPVAAHLIQSLLQPLAKRRVYWDIPDHQDATIELARKLGFHPQRSLVRMFLGEENVAGRPEMIHGLAGPEIG
jgi:ribosomal protein S18 acetylase RimI-like enzyme